MRSSLPRFLLVGGTTVLIDALVYQLLLLLDVGTGPGKAAAFVSGAVFAYFANWRFTFRGERNPWSPLLFALVYLGALGLNVLVNEAVLAALDQGVAGRVALAFLVATTVSAAWNFAGMAKLVFRPSSSRRSEELTS